MKCLWTVPAIALASLLLANCRGNKDTIEPENGSKISTLTIGDFKPDPDSKNGSWSTLSLQMERSLPTVESIKTSYAKNDNKDAIDDASLKVPYGTYRILLNYADKQGKRLYQSCPAEQTKDHSINVPKYLVRIEICSIATGAPAGVTDPVDPGPIKPEDSSDVGITPVINPGATKPQASSGSFVEKNGMLTARGGFLLNKNSEPVQLKGMSLFWSQWPLETPAKYWNRDVVSVLKNDWKSTLVRAAIAVELGGYLSNPETEKARVRTVVDAAVEQGIYVIIDWHDHNATQHTAEAVKFFSEMAMLYANTPNVIFEVFNEPINVSWAEVKQYAETVIKAIRSKNAKNLIIVGSPTWSQDVHLAADNPIKAENIAYALHFYAGTHRQDLRDKASYAISKGLTLFVTEFGVCDASGNGNIDLKETDIWLSFLDQHKISWANWSLNDKDESASALTQGASDRGAWSENNLTISGTYIKKKILQ